MWLQTERNKIILLALVLAGFLHAVFFSGVVFTMRGNAEQYRVGMVFWGSILRKQDLQPLVPSGKEIRKAFFFEPSRPTGMASEDVWLAGVMVDKPEAFSSGEAIIRLPQKFLTQKVELDDPGVEDVSGIPESPRIPLRMPRP